MKNSVACFEVSSLEWLIGHVQARIVSTEKVLSTAKAIAADMRIIIVFDMQLALFAE